MDYGLGTSIANGLKEGLIGYQTMRQIKNQEDQQKRQQQMQGLLSGVQSNQQTGQLEFTPEMRLQRAQEARIRENQESQLNPTSGPSQQARALMGGLLGPKTAIPEDMSAAQLKEYMPAIIAGMRGEGNDLDKQYKKAQINALNMKSEKGPELPLEDKLTVSGLSSKNANKIAISNQIDSVMSRWDKLSNDQKVEQGRQLLKVLNSTEGADAIGAEEAKRLGGLLEFKMMNFTQPGSFIGRDVDEFAKQARETSEGIKGAVKKNRSIIEDLTGRKSTPIRGLLNGDNGNKSEKPSWAL